MKVWEMLIEWFFAGIIYLAATVGVIMLCIWLGAKIVKAVM